MFYIHTSIVNNSVLCKFHSNLYEYQFTTCFTSIFFFLLNTVLNNYPCYTIWIWFIPSNCWILFLHLNILHFIHVLSYWWIFMLFSIHIYIYFLCIIVISYRIYIQKWNCKVLLSWGKKNAPFPQSHRQYPVFSPSGFGVWLFHIMLKSLTIFFLYVVRLYVVLFSLVQRIKYSNFFN